MRPSRDRQQLRDQFEARLAKALIARELLDSDELAEAVRHQVVSGGSLVTNLWELGLVDGRELSRLGAELLGIPNAGDEELERIKNAVLRLLPHDFVKEARILPIGVHRNNILRVATCEPWNHLALGEAASKSGYPVEPCFVAEIPLMRLLAKHYGIEIPGRFLLPLPAETRRANRDKKTALEDPWSELLELPADIATPIKKGSEREDSIVIQPQAGDLAESSTAPTLEPIIELSRALAALDEATDRDAIGRVLLRHALSKGSRAVLLLHRRGTWSGWAAAGDEVDPSAIHNLTLRPAPDTAFGLVSRTEAHFMGALSRHPTHDQFLCALGKQIPGAVGLFPVHFRGRLVFGLYLDAGEGRDIPTDVADLLLLAQRAPEALENLITKRLSRGLSDEEESGPI